MRAGRGGRPDAVLIVAGDVACESLLANEVLETGSKVVIALNI
jgi:hypothetical protein